MLISTSFLFIRMVVLTGSLLQSNYSFKMKPPVFKTIHSWKWNFDVLLSPSNQRLIYLPSDIFLFFFLRTKIFHKHFFWLFFFFSSSQWQTLFYWNLKWNQKLWEKKLSYTSIKSASNLYKNNKVNKILCNPYSLFKIKFDTFSNWHDSIEF